MDTVGRAGATGLGRSCCAEQAVRAARHARPVSAPVRASSDGLPLRQAGERRGDPSLRGDRDAPARGLSEPDLLRRIGLLAVTIWIGRWAAMELAAYIVRHRRRAKARFGGTIGT